MFITPGSRRGGGFYCQKWQVVGLTTIVSKVNAQSIPNNVFWTAINWDTLIRDDVGAWDPSNPSYFTPPLWAKMARLSFYAVWQNTTGAARALALSDNLQGGHQDYLSQNESGGRVTTGWVPIYPGADTRAYVFQNDGAARNFSGVGIFASPATYTAEWSPG